MSEKYTSWRDVKDKVAAADPRSDTDRETGRAEAAERRETYVRGYQLAEIRKAAGLTQAQLAEILGSVLDIVATLGDRSWKVA